MTLISQYNKLHKEMRQRCIDSGFTYLPNPRLFANSGDVDYCLIGMEPSPKGKDVPQDERDNSINFYSSIEDIILHYCAWRYLCASEFRYHITDVCKCVIPTKDADKSRSDRNHQWIPLLIKELKTLEPRKTIVIGKANYDSLIVQNEKAFSSATYVIHYSPSNKKHVREEFDKRHLTFTNVTEATLRRFHKTQLLCTGAFDAVSTKSAKIDLLLSSVPLSDHHRMLISIYKRDFDSIRKSK